MRILDPATTTFSVDEQGYLTVRCREGEQYANVECVALFPQSLPERYVSVLKKNEKEYDEIGVIKDLSELPAEQQDLVRSGVDYRYFIPEIREIKKVSSKQGLDEWEVVTDRGEKSFLVRDRRESLSISDHGTIFVTDVDKCRYRVARMELLSGKARAELERMLP
jgi:hypothetical protein